MRKNRLEAFSAGVLAIIITIMVLELKAPQSTEWAAVLKLSPVFVSYLVSFCYVGIYWNNHHHLLHAAHDVSAGILWANLHLLFWLSLLPFSTAWVGQNPEAAAPAALYGVVLLMSGVAYFLLQNAIIAQQGEGSVLAAALGSDWKGKLSPAVYLVAIPLAFYNPWLSHALNVCVALMWVIPDRRIERTLKQPNS